MNNTFLNSKSIVLLADFIKEIKLDNLVIDDVDDVIKELLPKKEGRLLINYNIKDKGFDIAKFIPKIRSINLCMNQVNKWLDENVAGIAKIYNENDISALRNYMFIYVLTHEISHSYQYLISRGEIDSPNKVLKDAYSGLFDILNPKEYIIPRPIKQTRRYISLALYKHNENFYLLERNANIESTNLVSRVALYNDREDMYLIFKRMENTWLRCGYMDTGMGSIEETYRKILMYDKYKKFYSEINIPVEEKIKYGFNISEEAIQKVLQKRI